MSWTDKARVSAAAQAVRELKDNTTVGLGSGNTILRALELAAERIKKENLRISFVPTSYQVEIAAKKLGLRTAELDEKTEPDLALDGADQVQWRTLDLVKGGGAALLREKIVDSTAKRLVIVIDEKKLAKTLGGSQPIPVEIVPFGYASTVEKIRKISEKAVLRESSGKVGPIVTDNGNLIADAYFRNLRRPDIVHEKLKKIPGVVETGLFLNMANTAYVGRKDGHVDILRRS
ncbi:MAG TPA: ribose 5-phosphate isomerase A [Candidatus Dormibacteraeota bacterium]|jgi:ribose 5-phosphate isomerase A|nr:ribose 5-phosphate isomerase A [Candidatus Dormibacteraeota bacterium]